MLWPILSNWPSSANKLFLIGSLVRVASARTISTTPKKQPPRKQDSPELPLQVSSSSSGCQSQRSRYPLETGDQYLPQHWRPALNKPNPVWSSASIQWLTKVIDRIRWRSHFFLSFNLQCLDDFSFQVIFNTNVCHARIVEIFLAIPRRTQRTFVNFDSFVLFSFDVLFLLIGQITRRRQRKNWAT